MNALKEFFNTVSGSSPSEKQKSPFEVMNEFIEPIRAKGIPAIIDEIKLLKKKRADNGNAVMKLLDETQALHKIGHDLNEKIQKLELTLLEVISDEALEERK